MNNDTIIKRRLPRGLWFIVVAIFLIIGWYGSLLKAVVQPTLIQSSYASGGSPALVSREDDETVSYPRLGVQAPLTELSQTDPFNYLDWEKIRPQLYHGVAATYSGQTFDASPNVFIVGHSSDYYPHAYASVFAPLGQAKLGDQVKVTTNQKTYNFSVVDKQVLSSGDTQAFTRLLTNDPNKQNILLVTCWPVLTTSHRLVVVAERTR